MNRRVLPVAGPLLSLAIFLGGCSGGGGIGHLPPTIATQPANQTVSVMQTATFSVVASGAGPFTYQWQKNAANISGATSSSYTTPPAMASDNGATFSVTVTNQFGSTPSNSANLTVHTGPVITSQPMNQTVSLGTTATFSVTATGTGTLSYQWQKNATNINGANSASYTTPPTMTTDNGAMFRVTVTDSTGSTPSNSATLTVSGAGGPGTDVVTFKNDAARTGQNLTETTLTTANVASATFGLKHNLAVTGKVDAQPLYVSQLNFSGTLHNTVFVATEHDLVYAFDADSGIQLWSVSVAPNGETTGDDHGCGQVSPEVGITSTPVIDRNAGAHGIIFVVAMTKDGAGTYHHRVHGLDLTTGAAVLGPTEVQATFPTSSGTTTFDAFYYKERPALLLLGGVIYTAWSSHCDNSPYTGWIIGYSETTLARTIIFNIGPNSGGGGPSIWMSGDGLAADSSGNLYLLAANGVFEQTMTAAGFPTGGDYGNAFVKISNSGGNLAVADYWEMDGEVSENGSDADLGSGGALLLPDLMDATNTVRHLAVGAGKDHNIYVVNRDNMGKFHTNTNNIWQEVDGVLSGGVWASPAYFNNTVYYGDVGGTLKAFSISSAKLSLSPTSQSTASFGYPGTSPTVSANGAAQGIVWVAESTENNPAVLHAFDATDLSKELYNSAQNAARDACGSGNKFIAVTIADGKVFMGTTNSVCVFGLLP